MSDLPEVRLRSRRPAHPWVFEKMVEKSARRLPPGSLVDLVDREGNWVGRGFFNAHSRIRVRVLTTRPEEAVDESLFARRIASAVHFRRETLGLDRVTNAYRLVHSEGDDLTGLVVDRYAEVLVIELFSAGMHRFLEAIREALLAHFPGSSFYWFAEEHVQKQESFDCRAPLPPPPVVIEEHGLRFRVVPGAKHKTGFFLDQRENRQALAEIADGKRVLDLCTNSGGFAIHARAAGNASEVVAVDVDEEAIALAKKNADLNQARVRLVQSDLFPWLRDAIANGERFDIVVLDPAKQTRSREELETALARYRDMNRLAFAVVRPGGVLVTCSCTGLVSEEAFLDVVLRSARSAGRRIQVFRVTGAAADHPFQVQIPESRYLKAVWCRVLE